MNCCHALDDALTLSLKSSRVQHCNKLRKHRASSAVAGTPRLGTFTVHDQNDTNPAVQAEQQDELRRKWAAQGWTTNEQMEEALCKWSRCHRAGSKRCCS